MISILKKYVFSIIYILLSLFSSPLVYSADTTFMKQKIIKIDALVASKNFDAAYGELKLLEWDYAGDPSFDLLLGVVANEVAEYGDAILAFERILAIDPEHTLARTEIAKSYFAQGELNSARYEFEMVQEKVAVSSEVSKSIESFLTEIHRRHTPTDQVSWSGYVASSLGYDSNVNRGVNDDLVDIPLFG